MLGQQQHSWQGTRSDKDVTSHGLLDIGDDELQDLIDQVKDYQLTHGFLLKLVRAEEPTTVPCRPVNVSLVPTAFPSRLFSRAQKLQSICNLLYVRVSSDPEWLHEILQPLLEKEGLASSLWQIWSKVRDAGVVQDVVCGIFRSDYMLHQPAREVSLGIRQVEMNTFSIAGACHAERAASMHRCLRNLERMTEDRERIDANMSLPTNDNTKRLTMALKAAHEEFKLRTSHPTCILMVTQPMNFNVADERPLEYGLQNEAIVCLRCDWQDVMEQTTLCPDRSLLFHRHGVDLEVSVIYYRAGYEAAEYDAAGRETRLRLELSRAIKCPDILTHLTTFKAVQTALTAPDALERFLSQADANEVRSTFMEMHPISSIEALAIALDPAKAADYVLKPNLEGGGHNIYRHEIASLISSLAEDRLADYVLMRMIQPPPRQGILMTSELLHRGPVVSELGVIGTCLWRRPGDGSMLVILSNETAGWTFKSKPASVNEMSVMKGYGCFDCPLLTAQGEDDGS